MGISRGHLECAVAQEFLDFVQRHAAGGEGRREAVAEHMPRDGFHPRALAERMEEFPRRGRLEERSVCRPREHELAVVAEGPELTDEFRNERDVANLPGLRRTDHAFGDGASEMDDRKGHVEFEVFPADRCRLAEASAGVCEEGEERAPELGPRAGDEPLHVVVLEVPRVRLWAAHPLDLRCAGDDVPALRRCKRRVKEAQVVVDGLRLQPEPRLLCREGGDLEAADLVESHRAEEGDQMCAELRGRRALRRRAHVRGDVRREVPLGELAERRRRRGRRCVGSGDGRRRDRNLVRRVGGDLSPQVFFVRPRPGLRLHR